MIEGFYEPSNEGMPTLITIDQFKNVSPDVDTTRYSDTTLSGMLDRAQQKAEDYLGYTLVRETITEKLEGNVIPNGDLVVYPYKLPINSVSSASIVKGSYSAALTLTAGGSSYYDIPAQGGSVVFDGSNLTGTTIGVIHFDALKYANFYVNLTYNAGYNIEDLPGAIFDAITLYLRDDLARGLNTSGATSISQGSLSISYAQRDGESDLIKDAKTLLDDYKVVTGW